MHTDNFDPYDFEAARFILHGKVAAVEEFCQFAGNTASLSEEQYSMFRQVAQQMQDCLSLIDCT